MESYEFCSKAVHQLSDFSIKQLEVLARHREEKDYPVFSNLLCQILSKFYNTHPEISHSFHGTNYFASLFSLELNLSSELVLLSGMNGFDYKKAIALLGKKLIDRNGVTWHFMRGKETRLWFKNYEPAECPEVWEGDFEMRGEVCLSRLFSLKGCPRVIHGSFDCSNAGLDSFDGIPEQIDGQFNYSYNYALSPDFFIHGLPKLTFQEVLDVLAEKQLKKLR